MVSLILIICALVVFGRHPLIAIFLLLLALGAFSYHPGYYPHHHYRYY